MTIVLVPHLNGIEKECENSLKELESAGIKVRRSSGCSAIDVARNRMASDALHEGYEAIFFIDSDIGFEAKDALKLINRPEPVISGVYAKKGQRKLASVFAAKEVLFGVGAPDSYPLLFAATGFLRIKSFILQKMIKDLNLPLCNTQWGKGLWPFFQPTIVNGHYLAEDWAFSYRLHRIGVTPLADTSIRLYHWGRYPYSWEDAGSAVKRYESYKYVTTINPSNSQ